MNIRLSNEKKIFNVHTDGIPYLSFDMLDRLGVPNLFSTRYESFDASEGTGIKGLRTALLKSETATEENVTHIFSVRDRLARQLGSSIEREYFTGQHHTNFVNVVREEDLGPLWPEPLPAHREFADGMVTDVPDALLTAFGGDCPPVYIADPVRGAIGLVHAGWRGTFSRIPAVAVAQMVVHFGCEPEDMYAAIGPGICRDCYEMGDEVYEAFESEWGEKAAESLLSKYPAADSEGKEILGGKYHLDLRAANRMTLLGAGIPEDHIAVSNVCTMCNVDSFYSYRARRMENHQAAMMVNRFGR